MDGAQPEPGEGERVSTGSSTEEIPLESIGGTQHGQDLDAKPPQYDDLSLHGDLPPLPMSYEEVLAAKAAQQRTLSGGSLIAEAPPTYIQLFGEQSPPPSTRRLRPHVRPRRDRGGQSEVDGGYLGGGRFMSWLDENKKAKFSLIVTFILLVLAVPVSMVIVGFVYYDVCKYSEIPLYLIVAGLLVCLEVILHIVLCTCKKYMDIDSGYKKLRRCDIIVFLLFIWLMVGSNWMFRLGVYDDECNEMIDGGIQSMNYTIDMNGTITQVTVSVGSEDMEDGVEGDTGEDCSDCSEGVYYFAAVVILIQYLIGLLLIAFCCSRFFMRSSD